MAETISVTQAIIQAKGAVSALGNFVVLGEVSGFRGPNNKSGHCYFSVKDERSSMDVIVWASIYSASGIELRDGMQLQLTGSFDIYAASGRLSFIAKHIEVAGEGILRQQVAALAKKLQAEGLMDASIKKHLPVFCEKIAVCTSLSGSVIEDVKRTLARRNPIVQITCVGCSVQGTDAPTSIVSALKAADKLGVDAILLVRGGGSFEDLMCFNSEDVARTIASLSTPIVTGIGHEPDTSIADMVADRRASTPTAAAESIAPSFEELLTQTNVRKQRLVSALDKIIDKNLNYCDEYFRRFTTSIRSKLQLEVAKLERFASARVLLNPKYIFTDRISALELSAERLQSAIDYALSNRHYIVEESFNRLTSVLPMRLKHEEMKLKSLESALGALSPEGVLSRGYAIVTNAPGHVISHTGDVRAKDKLDIKVQDGSISAQVTP